MTEDRVTRAEKDAGVYDCDVCGSFPCECEPPLDQIYDLREGK